jgi:diaminopimelate epimerase
MAVEVDFVKGHGAANDFVVIPDPDGTMAGVVDGRVAQSLVRSLCSRRTGIGADGLLRVVRTGAQPEARDQHEAGVEWFMDYYNADGSVGEMCGNGIRVFARYLIAADLADPAGGIPIGTRAGVKIVRVAADSLTAGSDDPAVDMLTVDMGVASVLGEGVQVRANGHSWPATRVDVGNPHLVVFVDDVADAGALVDAPSWTPADAMPHGANVEFVTRLAADHIRMRVFERGVGETQACGTGACAAALVAGAALEPPAAIRVDLPGGTLTVTLKQDGRVELTGPAELTFFGTIPVQPTD